VTVVLEDIELSRQYSDSEARRDLCSSRSGKGQAIFFHEVTSSNKCFSLDKVLSLHHHQPEQQKHCVCISMEGNKLAPCAESSTACSSNQASANDEQQTTTNTTQQWQN